MSDICKSDCLAGCLFYPLFFFLLSISEPCLVVLKHHGKKEVLRLIDEMEDEYDWPFRFNPEAVHAERATRSASAVEPGQWGYGINVYGKRRRYQAKPSEKSTLNAAMYGFWSDEEYNRVQAYLWTHGNISWKQ